MDKTKMKVWLILVMSMLVICSLAVPAIAKNITDAECGGCFGAMSPEITEEQIPALEVGINVSSKGIGEEVIWEDDFSTNPFSGRWLYWSGPKWRMGWAGDSVYLPYLWWVGDYYYYTCAQTMYHSFSTNNPFYGYYNPKIEYKVKSYSDNGQDAGFKVCFAYKHDGTWYGRSHFYHSPEEYYYWTTKNLDMTGFWEYMDWGDEYRVLVYEHADYSSYPDGPCDPWSEVKGHVYITHIKLIGTPNKAPYKPSNPSPADGATVGPTTDLSWTGGDPNGNDTVKYNVYLGTSPTSLSVVCSDISSTTCDPGTLNEDMVYYWKVVAKDEFGETTERDVWSFSTFPPPTLISPDNGSSISTITPTLTCSNVGSDYRYEFQVDNDPDFSSPRTQGFAGPAGDTNYIVGTDGDGNKLYGPLVGTIKYWWRARACKEGVGCGEWSEVWSFNRTWFMTICSPANGDTPVIYKDAEGNSYILLHAVVFPMEDAGPGCLVKVYSPSDQFLGEWYTHQTLSGAGRESYQFTIRVYVDNANVTLTGENTLRAYWMRGDPCEISAMVTVNLPSDYNEVVCGYAGNVPICLSPGHIEVLKEVKAEIEVQLEREDITDEAFCNLKDMLGSIDLVLQLEEHPGARVSGKALKALNAIHAAYQTKKTGGSYDDFFKRCINSFTTEEAIPFLTEVLSVIWESSYAPAKEWVYGPMDTWEGVAPWGYMEAGVNTTGEYLPANYYKNWQIGPYLSLLGPISGIMVELDYVYMGPGDYFTIYTNSWIPEWESTPGVRHVGVKRSIHDIMGRIVVDCDNSGADSYGFKFNPETWITLRCHHAEYYNYNETGTHLVKFGTEPTEINFSWGAGSPYPEITADNFAAVWSGQIYIPGNDTYTFYVASEHGTVDARINRTELFTNYIFDGPAEASNSTYLYEGWHNFVIYYHHTTGDASFVFSWANSTMSKQVVPDDNMRTARTELASLPLTAFFSYEVPEFGTNVSFTDLSFGDNITEWEWDFGDGTPVETYDRSVNPFHNYSAMGHYNVTLTVTNSTGGTSTYSEVINWEGGEIGEILNGDFEMGNLSYWNVTTMGGCGDAGVSSDTPDGSNYSAHISINWGSIGSVNVSQQFFLPKNARYLHFWMEVEPDPLYGRWHDGGFVYLDNDTSSTLLYKTGGGGGHFQSYPWESHSVDISSYAGEMVTLIFQGINSNGEFDHLCNIYFDDVYIFGPVNFPPTASFIYSPTFATTADIIQFNDTSTDSDGWIEEWFWDFGDGNYSILQNPTHQYAESGTYWVTLTVMDNNYATNSTSRKLVFSLADDFNDGNADGWDYNEDYCSVIDGEFVVNAPFGAAPGAWAGQECWSDYAVEADVMHTSLSKQRADLIGRKTSSGFYAFEFYYHPWFTDRVALLKFDSRGARTIATGSFPFEPNVWYHRKMEFIGSKIKCYVNGTKVIGNYSRFRSQ